MEVRTPNKNKSAKSKKEMDLNLNDSFLDKLMSDPVKRTLVLQLLSDEKDNIEKYNASPLKKLQRKYHCESPTALLRRRALEKQVQVQQDEKEDRNSSDSKSSSRPSSCNSVPSSPSPIPFEKLLEDVVAYVEVKSKDQDRSAGAKLLMQSMGATVKDSFTKDVTHVIFKDGSFSTYQKAKLKKVHLLSVLWLEAIRRNNARVPEKNYPALGTDAYQSNVSAVCSQIHKEYEDVIRDEIRRSLTAGTPLPSTKSLINRRRTMMTPILDRSCDSPINEQTGMNSNDQEVANITAKGRHTMHFDKNLTPELTSDDSECGMINGERSQQDTVMQMVQQLTKSRVSYLQKNDSTSSESLNNSKSLISCLVPKQERNKINTNNSDMDLTCSSDVVLINDVEMSGTTESLSLTKSKIAVIGESDEKLSKSVSSNKLCSDSKVVLPGESKTASTFSRKIEEGNSVSTMSSLCISTETDLKKSTNTSMSSLRVSCDAITGDNSVNTDMSLLQISAGSKDKAIETKSTDKVCNVSDASSKKSFSPLGKDVIENVIHILEDRSSPNHITQRRKTKTPKSSLTSEAKPCRPTSAKHRRQTLKGKVDETDKENECNVLPCSPSQKRAMRELQCTNIEQNNEVNKVLPFSEPRKRVTRKSMFVSNETLGKESEELSSVTKPTRVGTRKSLFVTPTLLDKSPQNLNKNMTNEEHCKSNSALERVDSCSVNNSPRHESPPDTLKKGKRKLYDPDAVIDEAKLAVISDEEERQNKRLGLVKESDEGVFLKPNLLRKDYSKMSSDSGDSELEDMLQIDSYGKAGKKQRKSRKNTTEQLNDSNDEQIELAKEYVDRENAIVEEKRKDDTEKEAKKLVTRRQSVRITQIKNKKDSSNASNNESETDYLAAALKRRSTMEFKNLSQSAKKKLILDKKKEATIVCTKLHRSEVQVFTEIVKKLGDFKVEDECTRRTTHLVAGEAKRTINMLRAMARGCWILKYEWVLKSLENGKWLPEEEYELTEFSPSVQKCRMQRQAFGPLYTMDIFRDCGPIFICLESIPRCSDLRELVTLCKGSVTRLIKSARIIVGEFSPENNVTCVKETWILDSITANKLLPVKKYILASQSSSPCV